mgnify:CR=1 FL=1
MKETRIGTLMWILEFTSSILGVYKLTLCRFSLNFRISIQIDFPCIIVQCVVVHVCYIYPILGHCAIHRPYQWRIPKRSNIVLLLLIPLKPVVNT